MRSIKTRHDDLDADPFGERLRGELRTRVQLLGGRFEFHCQSSQLHDLVKWAYAHLPPHEFVRPAPRFRVRVAHTPPERSRPRSEPVRIEMLSGGGLLCGTTGRSDFAVMSPASKSALVVISPQMLRFPYHTRYELIEFAVFTLAARGQGLMPLHAACIGQDDRAVLLLGASGAGKSTAALHCLLRGLEFVSEDSVFVEPVSLRASGVANFLHIRRDSLRRLPRSTAAKIRRSPIIRRRSGVEKLEIDLRRPEFRLAATPLRIAAIVFVSSEPATTRLLTARLPQRVALARFEASQPYAA